MFIPKVTILKKYADVVVKFALNSGKGINRGDVVHIRIPESAKPLLKHLQKSVLEMGGNILLEYIPEGIERDFFEQADKDQLFYYPTNYTKALFKEVDHVVRVISEWNPKVLEGVDDKKIVDRSNIVGGTFRKYLMEKEKLGNLTWTIILYPTQAMADEAKLTLEEYWEEVINACFLNEKDPISKWRETFSVLDKQKEYLNSINIDWLEVLGESVNLKVKVGKNRNWVAGMGRNIPSFEVFTSPNMYGTDGFIHFSEPLFAFDNLIEGIYLEFKDGKVVKATAKKGEKLLRKIISTKGADRLGEVSLTDKRLSRIHKFMAETLFDENAGGEYGNMHLALGQSFYECLKGDIKDVSKNEFKKLGFNHSSVHTDIVTRLDRTVYAIDSNLQKVKIYEKGMFLN